MTSPRTVSTILLLTIITASVLQVNVSIQTRSLDSDITKLLLAAAAETVWQLLRKH